MSIDLGTKQLIIRKLNNSIWIFVALYICIIIICTLIQEVWNNSIIYIVFKFLLLFLLLYIFFSTELKGIYGISILLPICIIITIVSYYKIPYLSGFYRNGRYYLFNNIDIHILRFLPLCNVYWIEYKVMYIKEIEQ